MTCQIDYYNTNDTNVCVNSCADNFHWGCLRQTFKCNLHYHYSLLRKISNYLITTKKEKINSFPSTIMYGIDMSTRKNTDYLILNKWFTIYHHD